MVFRMHTSECSTEECYNNNSIYTYNTTTNIQYNTKHNTITKDVRKYNYYTQYKLQQQIYNTITFSDLQYTIQQIYIYNTNYNTIIHINLQYTTQLQYNTLQYNRMQNIVYSSICSTNNTICIQHNAEQYTSLQ